MYIGFRQNPKMSLLHERILKVWHLSETPELYKWKQQITSNSKQESNFSACDVGENNSRLQVTTFSKCSANRQSMAVVKYYGIRLQNLLPAIELRVLIFV